MLGGGPCRHPGTQTLVRLMSPLYLSPKNKAKSLTSGHQPCQCIKSNAIWLWMMDPGKKKKKECETRGGYSIDKNSFSSHNNTMVKRMSEMQ